MAGEKGIVLGIVGSPNKEGRTNQLVTAALDGAAQAGVGRLVDLAHAACPDLGSDGVGAKRGTGSKGHGYGTGTRAVSSWNQFRTTWICAGGASVPAWFAAGSSITNR